MMRRSGALVVLVVVLLAAACGVSADRVTIYRDVWGVPHVYGDSELAAAYGYGYAQAQDRLEQIFRNYKQAEGTLAEVDGQSAFMGDFIARICGHAEYSRAQYDEMPARVRAFVEAYQAGIKRYMAEHPDQVPSWAPELHPAMATSVMRALIFNWPLGEMAEDLQAGGIPIPGLSSNEWTVSPPRTADKCAMLFIDPHIPWAGMFRFHEARIHAPGLDVSGWVPVGTPFVGLGHNNYIGWACTTGGPDTSDVYAETVDPDNPMRYKVNDTWYEFQVKNLEFKVKQGDKTSTVTKQLLISRHGPVLVVKDNKAYALATPYIDQTRQPLMLYRLNHARSTAEVKQICSDNQWMAQNFMYAGTDGHIRYIRAGRVPVRPQGVNPGKPIDGDTTNNDWLGIHPQSDLVQIDDPADGYMQNCNITPTIMSKDQPVDPGKYPPYIFNADSGRPWDSRWSMRGKRAVDLLDADDDVTLADGLRIANDVYLVGWENLQPMIAEACKLGRGEIVNAGPEAVQIVDTLVKWDGNMNTDSVGATLLYFLWRNLPKACPGVDRDALRRGDAKLTAEQYPQLLEAGRLGIEELVQKHGGWQVPWGQINRVGRGGRTFPLAGWGTDDLVTLRAVGGPWDDKTATILCQAGQSCTTLVLFKPGRVESYSVTPWGESDDPKSPHYLDQAEKLFSRRQLKPTWFQREDLLAGNNIESTLVLDYQK